MKYNSQMESNNKIKRKYEMGTAELGLVKLHK